MNCGKIYNLCLIFAHTCCLNGSEKMTGLCIKNTNNGIAIFNTFSIQSARNYLLKVLHKINNYKSMLTNATGELRTANIWLQQQMHFNLIYSHKQT